MIINDIIKIITINVGTYKINTYICIVMGIEQDIQQTKFENVYHKAFVNIIYTSAWLEYRHAAVFKRHDLTPAQFNILRILRGQHPKPSTINLLIERMIDKSSNASRIVEKLRLKGLVTREECPTDRRLVEVLITQKGLDLLTGIDENEKGFYIEPDHLTEKEAEQLSSLLDKIRM
jgi:DNA-binding MarR family transcriptional regulator